MKNIAKIFDINLNGLATLQPIDSLRLHLRSRRLFLVFANQEKNVDVLCSCGKQQVDYVSPPLSWRRYCFQHKFP